MYLRMVMECDCTRTYCRRAKKCSGSLLVKSEKSLLFFRCTYTLGCCDPVDSIVHTTFDYAANVRSWVHYVEVFEACFSCGIFTLTMLPMAYDRDFHVPRGYLPQGI